MISAGGYQICPEKACTDHWWGLWDPKSAPCGLGLSDTTRDAYRADIEDCAQCIRERIFFVSMLLPSEVVSFSLPAGIRLAFSLEIDVALK